MNRIAIIGGGASGLMAAVTAARNGAKVCVIEHKEQTGKKILSTGNGRCNFTNLHQEPICYHSENELFPWRVIDKFNVHQTISFFLELGVYSKNRNGYLYPQSDQASAVADVLRMEAERLGISFRTETNCLEIIPKKTGFKVVTDKGDLTADKVILATGSKAAPVLGSDGSGYGLAKTLGHHLIPVLPSLVQLRCKETFYKKISGVRVNGRVSLYVNEECMSSDEGELQLTAYGISGIPVFQISRYAAIGLFEKKRVTAILNFMPDFSEEQFYNFIKKRMQSRPQKTAEEFLIGLFQKKLSAFFLTQAGIRPIEQVADWNEKIILRLVKAIQCCHTDIQETNSFEQAQVCRGGIDTKEVSNALESMYIPGVYFAGEILDVDGLCGGYNLQWAWSSGYVAGKEAAGA